MIEKPAFAGLVSVHLKRLLTMFIRMELHGMYRSRFNNNVSNRLMGFKRAAAIDILTLMITLFGIGAEVTA
jgi:hypothetical protein